MKNQIIVRENATKQILRTYRQLYRPLVWMVLSSFLIVLTGMPALADAKSSKYSFFTSSSDAGRAVYNTNLDAAKFDNALININPLTSQVGGSDIASMLSGGSGGSQTGPGISATRMNAMGFGQRAVLNAQGIDKAQLESIGSRFGVGGAMSGVIQLVDGGGLAGEFSAGDSPSTLQMMAGAVMSDSNAFSNMLNREGSLTQVLEINRVSGDDGTAGRYDDSSLVPLSLLSAATASATTLQTQTLQTGSGQVEKTAASPQTPNQVNQAAQAQTNPGQSTELNTRLVVMSAETETKPAATDAVIRVDTNTYVNQIASGGEKATEAFASFSQSAGYLSAALKPELDAQARTSAITEAASRAEQGMDQLTQAGFGENTPEYQSGCAIMVLAKAAEYQLSGSDKTSIQSQMESYAAKSGDQNIIAFKDSFLKNTDGETAKQATDRRTTLLQQTIGETPAALTFETATTSQTTGQTAATTTEGTQLKTATSADQTTETSVVAVDQSTKKTSTEPVVPVIPAMTQLSQVSRQEFRDGFAYVRSGLIPTQSAASGAQQIAQGIEKAEANFAMVDMSDSDYKPANQLMGYFYAAGYLTTSDAAKKAEYATKMKDCAGRVNDADLEEIVQSALTIDPNADSSEKTITLLDKIRTFMVGTDETNAQFRGAYTGDTNEQYQQYEQDMNAAQNSAALQSYISAGTQNPYISSLSINATENTMIAPNVIFTGTATIGADVTIGEIDPKEVITEQNQQPGQELQPQTTIGSGVSIGDGTHVGPGAQIEDGVTLGKNVMIGSNVVIKAGTTVPDGVRIFEGTYPPEAATAQTTLLPAGASVPQMTQYDLAGSADYVLGQLPSGEAKSSLSGFRSTLDTARQSTTPSLTDIRSGFGQMVGKVQSVADDSGTPANENAEANNAAVLLICGAMLLDQGTDLQAAASDPDFAVNHPEVMTAAQDLQNNYRTMLQYFANNAGDLSIQQLGLSVLSDGAALHEEEIRQALGW